MRRHEKVTVSDAWNGRTCRLCIVHNYSNSNVKVATQFEIQMNKISALPLVQIIQNVLFLVVCGAE
jgi:hypothetical protein